MISENIVTLRKKYNFSQEEVAEKIGVTRQTIAKWENGESVAFTCAYAGNMKNIAEYLRKLQEKEMFDRIEVAEEMEILFTGDRELYESPEKKQQLLRQYTEKCAHDISGNTIVIRLDQLSRNLDEKADWMMENIRRRKPITKTTVEPMVIGMNASKPIANIATTSKITDRSISIVPKVPPCPLKVLLLSATFFSGIASAGSSITFTG